jgi:hypothetical protein
LKTEHTKTNSLIDTIKLWWLKQFCAPLIHFIIWHLFFFNQWLLKNPRYDHTFIVHNSRFLAIWFTWYLNQEKF